MSRTRLRQRLARLEDAAGKAIVPAPAPESPTADDGRNLAREMAVAFSQMIEHYRKVYTLAPQEALARAGEPNPSYEESVLNCPPDQVSWLALEAFAQRDAERAQRRWEEVKRAARDERRSGHRAARTLEGCEGFNSSCWGRAMLLAIRAELAEAWRPRDAQERELIDQMAQFQALLEHWQETATLYTSLASRCKKRTPDGRDRFEPPRVSDVEALGEAMGMVERWHRLYLRALRALQDLRRRGPSVVVRRAAQVNIGEQQLNVTTGTD
jgi:hypothetical protein